MGLLYEEELGDMKSAVEAYEKGAGWYENDRKPA